MTRKPPCTCGHNRSDHRYIKYGPLLSVRSPCNKCGRRYFNVRHDGVEVSEHKCGYYVPMDNLKYIEWLADKKHLI